MTDTTAKRATVYFDPLLHRALRLKAAATERSISDLVNEAIRALLAEDADDFAAFEARESEPDYAFEDAVKDLKRRGKL
jgi:plasmid stability protein